MPKTRLISPGSIPNHKLLKNLQLKDNYISNDGGDEGIRVNDIGNVGVNNASPVGKLHVDGLVTADQFKGASNWTRTFYNYHSLYFDGTDAGVLTIPLASTFHSGTYTISFWINVSDVTATDANRFTPVAQTWDVHGGFKFRVNANLNGNATSGELTFIRPGAVTLTSMQSSDGDTVNLTLSAGVWYHVAATCDGSTAKLFVNGVLVDTDSSVGTDAISNDIELGAAINDTFSNDFKGYIDEFAIFNEDKSGDIAKIYNSGKPINLSNESGLQGYWRMEEGTGTTVADDSSNSNTGTGNVIWADELPSFDGSDIYYNNGDVGIGASDPGSLLEVRGPVGTGTASAGVLTLSTAETSVRVGTLDQLGRIEFQAPKEAGGTDAILVGASIYAQCEEDFSSSNNSTALVLATGTTSVPIERLRIDQDGEVTVDRNVVVATTTSKGIAIDYDHTSSTDSDQTMIGLDVSTVSGSTIGGAQTLYGVKIYGSLSAASGSGSTNSYGIYSEVAGNTNASADLCTAGYFKASSTDTNTGVHINCANGGDDLIIQSSASINDWFKIQVGVDGVTTLSTNDAGAAIGHLNIEPDGHVEFDGCGVGFDKVTNTFAAAGVTSESDDSTDIDFRAGNKHQLFLSDNIGGSGENINMIFPAVSGNFLLVIGQDATGSRTVAADGWKAYASDASLADNTLNGNLTDGDVRWAGGSAPTLSTGGKDIDVISIYWDADTQTALAVASLDFATP